MSWFSAPDYWVGRLVLERGVAVIYLLAFVAAAAQFRALIGEHGMLPIPRFLAGQSWRRTPSIFHLHYSDRLFAALSWFGAALSAAIVAGAADAVPLWAAMLMWLTLWVLYLSIVNVGQTWYSFGWESLLLETGFLMIFLGNAEVAPPLLTLWMARLLLFRVEFGAGLIKMRGDPCWRDLTCLYYHHETQPMPGPLSWFFHHLPKPLHRIEVAGNHFAQLIVPFGLFAPQPVAGVAAAIIVVTQLWLVASGNFAWLNWVTILLACSAIDDSSVALLLPKSVLPGHGEPSASPLWFVVVVGGGPPPP
uniref:lipase maturation factor family protein n=2 Tax=Mycobacterium avium TaxID=1764 RepID=UPI0005789F4F